MRILMVTDFYWPYAGGVEQHVRHLSHALVARGYDVAVATLAGNGTPGTDTDGAVRVYRLRSAAEVLQRLHSHSNRPWAPPLPDPLVLGALRRIVTRERPAVVHGHDWLARSFLPLKRWSGSKLVASLHYYTLSCAKKSLMYRGVPCSGPGLRKCIGCGSRHYGMLKGTSTVVGNWAFSARERTAVDMFLPVSRATAAGNGLIGHRWPYEVIPNFVPDADDAWHEAVDGYVAQLPDTDFLLFVGDLRHDKGLDVLLQAYAGLRGAPPLVLIGKVWPETPTTFPSNVIVLRDWPNAAVMAAWRRCLVAIVPSIWPEPFGLVVIEAMASGRPVVASRIGGIPDMIIDEQTGLLVPPGDASALRQALERLLAEPALCARLGVAARKKSAEYRVSAVVPRIERVYQALVSGAAPA